MVSGFGLERLRIVAERKIKVMWWNIGKIEKVTRSKNCGGFYKVVFVKHFDPFTAREVL
jgi:hypothetical protein